MDSFSLYDNLPLFTGDQLVDWNPLASEFPCLVTDDLQQFSEIPTLYPDEDPTFKGSGCELPEEDVKPSIAMDFLDTNVELAKVITSKIPEDQTKKILTAEELLQVSEMLLANISNAGITSKAKKFDLSELPGFSEEYLLNEDEIDYILPVNDTEINRLFSASTGLSAETLSPVSPEDIDSILSQNPNSPESFVASSPYGSDVHSFEQMSPSPYSEVFENSFQNGSSDSFQSSEDDCSFDSLSSVSYLREELLKPTLSPTVSSEHLKSVSYRQKSHRQKVKYQPYSPSSENGVKKPVHGTKTNENKQQRKKQQNKDAALRYRQKKRDEKMGVHKECEELEDKNNELKEKVDSMTREIQYLKDLLAEIYKAKSKKE